MPAPLRRPGDGWYASYAARIERVANVDVRAAARALLPSRSVRVVVVGDLARIPAELDGLGLGNPEHFDLDGLPDPAVIP